MVVIATPTSHPVVQCCDTSFTPAVVNPVPCAAQNVVTAPVSTVNGQPVPTRMRAVSVSQGQTSTISWQLHNKDGVPVSLTSCVNALTDGVLKIVLRLKEQIALGNQNPVLTIDVDHADGDIANGIVGVTLAQGITDLPGIYYAEIAVVNTDVADPTNPAVIFSNTFYLIINRSTFGSSIRSGGPPSIAEIRLHLRDSSPTESYLLDNLMFDDAEIALAIARPVQYWNEIPPPLDQVYNTQNFPFRYHWLEGICANLFMMVAEQFRRNQLDYQAGGMAVNDQNKEANYERAGQARWQAYREWVRATKASINLEGCWGSVESNYKYSAYTDAIRIRY
jgi:hypothetical protein